MPELRLLQLSKTFRGGATALRQLDLDVEDGELLVLMGASGCGKTTTLRLIAGFERPDAGTILWDQQPLNHKRPASRPLSLVLQGENLLPHLTVQDNLRFGATSKAESGRWLDVIEILKLKDLLERFPQELSGGQRQSVAVARSLLRSAPLALYDEPLAHLDAVFRRDLRLHLRQFQLRDRQTVIYVTHDQTDAMAIADRIALMHEGRVIQVGSPTELYERPAHRVTAEWMGNPAMNLWRAEYHAGWMKVGTWTAEAAIPIADGCYEWGLRGEHVRWNAEGSLRWRGTVELVEFHGDHRVIGVRTDVGLIMISERRAERLRLGTSVDLSCDAESLFAFDVTSGQCVQSPFRA